MSGKTLYATETLRTADGTSRFSPVKILAVGEPQDWQQQGRSLPNGAMAFVSFNELSAELLDQLAPSVIVSPVLALSFDCIELATLLYRLGFTGAYRAVSKSLPKPELIEREVRQICGRLDFCIVKAH